MPLIDTSDYIPARAARLNGHFGTILPYLRPCPAPVPWTQRQRIETPDGDFIDLDLRLNNGSSLLICCHGLEGDASSGYIRTLIAALRSIPGLDFCGLNSRGCSGEPNRTIRAYHAAATDDLALAIRHFSARYPRIFLAGFSLGACQILNYLGSGKHEIPANVLGAATVSPPCNLLTSGERFERPLCAPYTYRFMRTLKPKVLDKIRRFPGTPQFPDPKRFQKIRLLREFDDLYTAPVHGFRDATDYYTQASPIRHLEKIDCPTLILSAEDDPFLSPECLPRKTGEVSKYLHVAITPCGGHVRFPLQGGGSYADRLISRFLKENGM